MALLLPNLEMISPAVSDSRHQTKISIARGSRSSVFLLEVIEVTFSLDRKDVFNNIY